MATVDSNFFELQRRAYQWNRFSTLDDGSTSLVYDSDPNLAVSGNTPGETKLVAMPIGAFYITSTGVLYFKSASPNTWKEVSLGVTSGPVYQTYDFLTPSLEWVVTHNKATTNFIKNLFDDSGEEFQAKVTILDPNSFKVTLTTAAAGRVEVVFPPG